LRLRIANSRVIEEAIRAHEVDLGVVGGHGLTPGEECLAAGLVDELVLIMGPKHRWARRREVVPADLPDEPLLVREEGSATRRVTERALDQAGSAGVPRWSWTTRRRSSTGSWPWHPNLLD
jgi:DNA-binding transcriptional LysR family regulator